MPGDGGRPKGQAGAGRAFPEPSTGGAAGAPPLGRARSARMGPRRSRRLPPSVRQAPARQRKGGAWAECARQRHYAYALRCRRGPSAAGRSRGRTRDAQSGPAEKKAAGSGRKRLPPVSRTGQREAAKGTAGRIIVPVCVTVLLHMLHFIYYAAVQL
uniref:Uncharacterized protein n=1 Tax=Sphaerodactylus townsendi TaxID=933632 RepID=A0ACB8FJP3_9SAUR